MNSMFCVWQTLPEPSQLWSKCFSSPRETQILSSQPLSKVATMSKWTLEVLLLTWILRVETYLKSSWSGFAQCHGCFLPWRASFWATAAVLLTFNCPRAGRIMPRCFQRRSGYSSFTFLQAQNVNRHILRRTQKLSDYPQTWKYYWNLTHGLQLDITRREELPQL